ncbi:MAG: hypothetical protein U0271_10930 [Polyangiaceae bacterium]
MTAVRRGRLRRATAWLGAALWLLGASAAACTKSEPRAFECHCSYLMDTDVPGTIDVSVCIEGAVIPETKAAECAQGQGVGHVEKCTCTEDASACAPSQPCAQAAKKSPSTP